MINNRRGASGSMLLLTLGELGAVTIEDVLSPLSMTEKEQVRELMKPVDL